MVLAAQLFVDVARPPMDVALRQMPSASCSSVTRQSRPGATAPANTVIDAGVELAARRDRDRVADATGRFVTGTIAARTSVPVDADLLCTPATRMSTRVPMWAMLRMSQSSDAAASLSMALTRAVSMRRSFAPVEPDRGVGPAAVLLGEVAHDCGRPMAVPGAALAKVLAMMHLGVLNGLRGQVLIADVVEVLGRV